MVTLNNLGFSKGVIVEIILSTFSIGREPNAAPMGVTMQDEQHLIVNHFNTSQTYRNIVANRCGVINLTNNIETFYLTTFKEANPSGKLPREWFLPAEIVKAPRFQKAEATIEVTVDHLENLTPKKTRICYKVVLIKSTQQNPLVINRAINLTLEAIIHATRVKAFLNDNTQQAHITKLLNAIDDCHQVVKRVAPNSEYSHIMDDLAARIEGWRQQK